MSDIRYPTQKRSIEKRNKIILKGFELMCQNGYYNTTTSDIAEYAGVSTGIIYQYFNDKKDIFIEGVKNYATSIMYPMIDVLKQDKIDFSNLESLIDQMIERFIQNHTISKKEHEELLAMSHLDEDIGKIFKDTELDMTLKIVFLLNKNNIIVENPLDKVHIIVNMIDNYCHEVVYHQHNKIDYSIMRKEIVSVICNMLK